MGEVVLIARENQSDWKVPWFVLAYQIVNLNYWRIKKYVGRPAEYK